MNLLNVHVILDLARMETMCTASKILKNYAIVEFILETTLSANIFSGQPLIRNSDHNSLHIWLNNIDRDKYSLLFHHVTVMQHAAPLVYLFDVHVTTDLGQMEQVANMFI